MVMHKNSQQELFSYAYVRAVAAVVGYSVQEKTRPMDNAGLDLTIEVPGELEGMDCPKFDAQVKCTTSLDIIKENSINFALPVKNYEKLRSTRSRSPQILIVVLVPKKVEDWIDVSEQKLIMKKCGYWASLKSEPSTDNKDNITVYLPRQNLLTPHNLETIMKKIAKGEEL